MRASERVQQEQVTEVASLLLPLVDQLLLLPNVTVAEIVPVGQITAVSDAPDWYLGDFHWRGVRVPLVSFEQLNGGERPEISARSRVAVLNTTGLGEEQPFTALLTQGLPRLARVNREEISEQSGADKQPFDLMRVSLAGEEAVVPDVARIEKTCLESRGKS